MPKSIKSKVLDAIHNDDVETLKKLIAQHFQAIGRQNSLVKTYIFATTMLNKKKCFKLLLSRVNDNPLPISRSHYVENPFTVFNFWKELINCSLVYDDQSNQFYLKAIKEKLTEISLVRSDGKYTLLDLLDELLGNTNEIRDSYRCSKLIDELNCMPYLPNTSKFYKTSKLAKAIGSILATTSDYLNGFINSDEIYQKDLIMSYSMKAELFLNNYLSSYAAALKRVKKLIPYFKPTTARDYFYLVLHNIIMIQAHNECSDTKNYRLFVSPENHPIDNRVIFKKNSDSYLEIYKNDRLNLLKEIDINTVKENLVDIQKTKVPINNSEKHWYSLFQLLAVNQGEMFIMSDPSVEVTVPTLAKSHYRSLKTALETFSKAFPLFSKSSLKPSVFNTLSELCIYQLNKDKLFHNPPLTKDGLKAATLIIQNFQTANGVLPHHYHTCEDHINVENSNYTNKGLSAVLAAISTYLLYNARFDSRRIQKSLGSSFKNIDISILMRLYLECMEQHKAMKYFDLLIKINIQKTLLLGTEKSKERNFIIHEAILGCEELTCYLFDSNKLPKEIKSLCVKTIVDSLHFLSDRKCIRYRNNILRFQEGSYYREAFKNKKNAVDEKRNKANIELVKSITTLEEHAVNFDDYLSILSNKIRKTFQEMKNLVPDYALVNYKDEKFVQMINNTIRWGNNCKMVKDFIFYKKDNKESINLNESDARAAVLSVQTSAILDQMAIYNKTEEFFIEEWHRQIHLNIVSIYQAKQRKEQYLEFISKLSEEEGAPSELSAFMSSALKNITDAHVKLQDVLTIINAAKKTSAPSTVDAAQQVKQHFNKYIKNTVIDSVKKSVKIFHKTINGQKCSFNLDASIDTAKDHINNELLKYANSIFSNMSKKELKATVNKIQTTHALIFEKHSIGYQQAIEAEKLASLLKNLEGLLLELRDYDKKISRFQKTSSLVKDVNPTDHLLQKSVWQEKTKIYITKIEALKHKAAHLFNNDQVSVSTLNNQKTLSVECKKLCKQTKPFLMGAAARYKALPLLIEAKEKYQLLQSTLDIYAKKEKGLDNFITFANKQLAEHNIKRKINAKNLRSLIHNFNKSYLDLRSKYDKFFKSYKDGDNISSEEIKKLNDQFSGLELRKFEVDQTISNLQQKWKDLKAKIKQTNKSQNSTGITRLPSNPSVNYTVDELSKNIQMMLKSTLTLEDNFISVVSHIQVSQKKDTETLNLTITIENPVSIPVQSDKKLEIKLDNTELLNTIKAALLNVMFYDTEANNSLKDNVLTLDVKLNKPLQFYMQNRPITWLSDTLQSFVDIKIKAELSKVDKNTINKKTTVKSSPNNVTQAQLPMSKTITKLNKKKDLITSKDKAGKKTLSNPKQDKIIFKELGHERELLETLINERIKTFKFFPKAYYTALCGNIMRLAVLLNEKVNCGAKKDTRLIKFINTMRNLVVHNALRLPIKNLHSIASQLQLLTSNKNLKLIESKGPSIVDVLSKVSSLNKEIRDYLLHASKKGMVIEKTCLTAIAEAFSYFKALKQPSTKLTNKTTNTQEYYNEFNISPLFYCSVRGAICMLATEMPNKYRQLKQIRNILMHEQIKTRSSQPLFYLSTVVSDTELYKTAVALNNKASEMLKKSKQQGESLEGMLVRVPSDYKAPLNR